MTPFVIGNRDVGAKRNNGVNGVRNGASNSYGREERMEGITDSDTRDR